METYRVMLMLLSPLFSQTKIWIFSPDCRLFVESERILPNLKTESVVDLFGNEEGRVKQDIHYHYKFFDNLSRLVDWKIAFCFDFRAQLMAYFSE